MSAIASFGRSRGRDEADQQHGQQHRGKGKRARTAAPSCMTEPPSFMPDVFGRERHRRRRIHQEQGEGAASAAAAPQGGADSNDSDDDFAADTEFDVLNDTMAAFLHLRDVFPVDKFEYRLPPMVLKHQLYTVVPDRTVADRELDYLLAKRRLRIIQLDSHSCDVLLTCEDYDVHVQRLFRLSETAATGNDATPSQEASSSALSAKQKHQVETSREILERFLTMLATKDRPGAIGITHAELEAQSFTTATINVLVQHGLLTRRSRADFWISLPNAGVFLKHLRKGRTEVLHAIARTKFKEIAQSKLEKRALRGCKLSAAYIINDMLGLQTVLAVPTSSGNLLRAPPKE
eukprot:m.29635 g.29635  ORF g.29635 m.29635 type:complete len:348 (+) comp9207_c0_seq1:131-1174(+)